MTERQAVQHLSLQDGSIIAYHKIAGEGPGVIFMGGFMSDMTGTKATALQAHCQAHGRAFIRFDYRGHGQSSGAFRDGTIGGWRDDALAVIDELADGPQVVVGSSMGGWIAMLCAVARPDRVAGLVGVAAAPDFTRDLMWTGMTDSERRTIMEQGHLEQPTEYGDEPYIITRRLIEDGDDHMLLGTPVAITCPVRLIQGMKDADVPWRTALRIAEQVESGGVVTTLVKDGDHRLSTPEDIARLCAAVDELCGG
ncbi:MAG: alpha/beta hydrolase [Sphingomonadales bacterium]